MMNFAPNLKDINNNFETLSKDRKLKNNDITNMEILKEFFQKSMECWIKRVEEP